MDRVMILSGLEMEHIRVKAAAHIFCQNEKNGYVRTGEVFDMSIVDLSDIFDTGWYYGCMLFVPVLHPICKLTDARPLPRTLQIARE